MGQPAAKANDKVQGQCPAHQVPSPTGSPMPSPAPLPFSAALVQGLATTVFVEGMPAAVEGSSGFNVPPHAPLHASDPFFSPTSQEGKVAKGSGTVSFDGKPAAYSGCQTTICQGPGQLTGTATTVLVGP